MSENGARPEPGHSPQRLTFFTDSIFAIAMTLLAVELKRPDQEQLESSAALGRFLVDQRSSFLAFALAFVLLWSVWRRHHQLMDRIHVLSNTFTFWHAPFLLLVAFLPFPTAVIGSTITNPMAQTLFAGTMAGIFFCEVALKEVSADSGLVIGDAAEARAHANGSWAVALWFVLSLGLAWVFPYAYVLWFFAPLAAGRGRRLVSRLRTRRSTGHDGGARHGD
ncbi:DUF1211 domain-containing protein [Streptomyces sp. SID11233]|nr:DUF1211 domain-containing protein [Streptomyces sp. SID11233]